MKKAGVVSKPDKRKPYPKPSYAQLPAEQARSFLLERANRGHKGAKEMLELMFPDANNSRRNAARSSA